MTDQGRCGMDGNGTGLWRRPLTALMRSAGNEQLLACDGQDRHARAGTKATTPTNMVPACSSQCTHAPGSLSAAPPYPRNPTLAAKVPGPGRVSAPIARHTFPPCKPGRCMRAPLITPPHKTSLPSVHRTSSVSWHLPLATSHMRTVMSSLPLASCRPSGLNATLSTDFVWPYKKRHVA